MSDKIFQTAFDTYVCEGDTITADVSGFTITARIYRDDTGDAPDERDDGFWPSLDASDAGYVNREDFESEHAKAQRAMDAWRNDEWFYCGVAIQVSRAGVDLTNEYGAALWGIEANYPGSDNAYLTEVAEGLVSEALDAAKAKLAELIMSAR